MCATDAICVPMNPQSQATAAGAEWYDSGIGFAVPVTDFKAIIERMPDIRDDVELAAWMLESAGVAMVPGTAFGAPGHLRLSFATSMENLQACVQRIKDALGA